MTTKSEPVKTAPRAKAKHLADDEVQALADLALSSWESGIEADPLDSLGGVWAFTPIRSERSGLSLVRTVGEGEDALVHRQFVTGLELGAVNVRHALASMVNALVNPA